MTGRESQRADRPWQGLGRSLESPLSDTISAIVRLAVGLGGRSVLPAEGACQEAALQGAPLQQWVCLDGCPALCGWGREESAHSESSGLGDGSRSSAAAGMGPWERGTGAGREEWRLPGPVSSGPAPTWDYSPTLSKLQSAVLRVNHPRTWAPQEHSHCGPPPRSKGFCVRVGTRPAEGRPAPGTLPRDSGLTRSLPAGLPGSLSLVSACLLAPGFSRGLPPTPSLREPGLWPTFPLSPHQGELISIPFHGEAAEKRHQASSYRGVNNQG